MNIMIRYCPYCKADHQVKKVIREATYKFRNEPFTINEEVLVCQNCYHDVPDDELDNTTLKLLSELYVQKHEMTAEDIRNIRNLFGMSQTTFAKVLGWGRATVARYELGTIPSGTHLSILKMLKSDSAAIGRFYEETKEVFSTEDQKLIEARIKSLTCYNDDLEKLSFDFLKTMYSKYDEKIDTGYMKFDPQKLFNMILYFAGEGILKTKLMKLLWYSDFLMFKRNLISISGTPYWRFSHGPVPVHHDTLIGFLESLDIITINEEEKNGYIKITLSANEPFDKTIFEEDELQILNYINHYFKDYGSVQISEISHQEDGWKENSNRKIISYNYAIKLSLN